MTTKYLVYTALMTAIIGVLGFVPAIPLPIMPVPIVLQNIGIFLAGILLGRKYGALSVIVLLLLVATCGLPVIIRRKRRNRSIRRSLYWLFIHVSSYCISRLVCIARDLYFKKYKFYYNI